MHVRVSTLFGTLWHMPPAAQTRTTPRPRSPRGEGESLRIDLLDAAAELMATHGSIDKVSVRAVAAAAGVSPTAVYRHFDNHTDLLWAAVQYCFDEFATAMRSAWTESDDVYERLAKSGRAYIRFALEETGKYRVMFSNRVPLPEREEPVGMHAFDELVAKVRDILDDRGDDRDPEVVSVQIWSWIHGMVDLLGNHPELDMWPDAEAALDEMQRRLDLVPQDD